MSQRLCVRRTAILRPAYPSSAKMRSMNGNRRRARMNDEVQQEAQRVDQDVRFATFDLLARVVARRIERRPPFRRLRVDSCCRRARHTAFLLAHSDLQFVMDALQRAVQVPELEINTRRAPAAGFWAGPAIGNRSTRCRRSRSTSSRTLTSVAPPCFAGAIMGSTIAHSEPVRSLG
jgi:hypothetical protein